MITASIILSSVSAIALIWAILFEGELKKENRKGKLILVFKGWFLIIVTLLMCFGNGYLAVKNIQDNDYKYKEDSTRFTVLLNEATKKRISDSIQISDLKSKSESIKLAVVDNAVKAMDEQRKEIERDRENTFAHFQFEVGTDLAKTIVNYDKKNIMGFYDTTTFVGARLSNLYMKKFESVSSNKVIINYLMVVSEFIDKINYYMDDVIQQPQGANRKLSIRMFLANVENVKPYLYSLFIYTHDLKSYRKYESMDFNKFHKYNPDSINKIVLK